MITLRFKLLARRWVMWLILSKLSYRARMSIFVPNGVTEDGRILMSSEAKRLERLQVMMSEEELKALDDWRFQSRMPSRAAAVRELLRRGLAAEGYFSVAKDRSSSRSFSVLRSRGEES